MSLFNYECDEVKYKIDEVSPNYPQLTTYEKEWLYFYKYGYIPGIPVELEYETVNISPSATVLNAIPYRYKSAILKGNTKYRDIDTGDILDTFDETKNLELVSVKMPVLTTSNGDDTKTNILTVNEEVELRGIGNVQDTLDLITGELTERICEIVLDETSELSLHKRFSEQGCVSVRLNLDKPLKVSHSLICDKLPYITFNDLYNGIKGIATSSDVKEIIYFCVSVDDAKNCTINDVKQQILANPLTIQYPLETESVKTVDLTTLNKPYEGINNYQLTANIPCEAILEVPVVSTGEQTLSEINNY